MLQRFAELFNTLALRLALFDLTLKKLRAADKPQLNFIAGLRIAAAFFCCTDVRIDPQVQNS